MMNFKYHCVLAFLLNIYVVTFTASAYSYPIFFKCDSEGHLSDVLTPEELDNYLKGFLAMDAEDQGSTAKSLCRGLQGCLAEFEKIIALTSASKKIAEENLKQMLVRMGEKLNTAFRKVPSEVVALQKKIINLGRANYLCQSEKRDIEPKDFITENGFYLFFPYKNNYMYVTGCRSLKADKCKGMDEAELNTLIEDSVKMDTDPYSVVAIGLMEQGLTPQHIYLDPIGAMKVMGCHNTPLKGDVEGALESFGGYHKVSAGVVKNPEMTRRISDFLKTADKQTVVKKGFYCRDTTSRGGEIEDNPNSKQCCLEFKNRPSVDADIDRAMTLEYVRQVSTQPYPGTDTPPFRLQRFNGFSKLMGGAESVAAFRAGVNYFEDPAYGYQASDYILNSLMSNAAFRAKVEAAQKKFGKKPSHIFCSGVDAGYYMIDSEYYFLKHKNSKRLGVLAEKIGKGATYGSLSEREKKVLDSELSDNSVAPLIADKAVQERIEQVMDFIKNRDPSFKPFKEPEDNGYLERAKMVQAAKKTLREKLSALRKLIPELDSNYVLRSDIEKCLGCPPERLDEIKKMALAYREAQAEYEEMVKDLKALKKEIKAKGLKKFEYKESAQVIKELKLDPKIAEDKKFLEIYERVVADSMNADLHTDARVKKYFATVYAKRDTVSKASDYAWTPLSLQEAFTLGRKIRDKKNK